MSGTNAGHQPHTDQDAAPNQKPSDNNSGSRIPEGHTVDHHAPDSFLVRCASCGQLEIYSPRARAHRKADHHGLECSPTGITPITELEIATDGGKEAITTDRTLRFLYGVNIGSLVGVWIAGLLEFWFAAGIIALLMVVSLTAYHRYSTALKTHREGSL
jgi:hypothetical protein